MRTEVAENLCGSYFVFLRENFSEYRKNSFGQWIRCARVFQDRHTVALCDRGEPSADGTEVTGIEMADAEKRGKYAISR